MGRAWSRLVRRPTGAARHGCGFVETCGFLPDQAALTAGIDQATRPESNRARLRRSNTSQSPARAGSIRGGNASVLLEFARDVPCQPADLCLPRCMRSKKLTREQRRVRARLAAHASWANTEDRSARTAPARAAALARFEVQVDPDRLLPTAERERRAQHARRAYFLSLAMRSSQARRRGVI